MTELFTALFKFQQEVPVIFKATKAFNYNYADLPAIIEVIRPLLKKNSLVFTQPLDMRDGVQGITTIICHTETGQILEGFVGIGDVELKGQNTYQSLGSGITYLRRYSLESMLGLVTSKDDDGGGSSANKISDLQSELPKLSPRDKDKWPKAVALAKKNNGTDCVTKHYSMIPADLNRLKKEAGLS